ncbi:hypothetical protein LTS18_002297, partial [Coniosporium uncinatum]
MPSPHHSFIDPTIPSLTPSFPPTTTSNPPSSPPSKSPALSSLIKALNLQPHIEGGYFAETDRDPLLVPNPFISSNSSTSQGDNKAVAADDDKTRNASTTIFYLLTPQSPQGHFHRNKARTVHTLHRGRGRYVLIHAEDSRQDGETGKWMSKARVETFVVGQDVEKGERLQWVVGGGVYKASYLLPDREDGGGEEAESGGLLISETVVPGFEYGDHDFLREETFGELVGEEEGRELGWL